MSDQWIKNSTLKLVESNEQLKAQIHDALSTGLKKILINHNPTCFGLYINFDLANPKLLVINLHSQSIVAHFTPTSSPQQWQCFGVEAKYFGFENYVAPQWQTKVIRKAIPNLDISGEIPAFGKTILSASEDSSVWDEWDCLAIPPTWQDMTDETRILSRIPKGIRSQLFTLVAYSDYDGFKLCQESINIPQFGRAREYLGGRWGIQLLSYLESLFEEENLFLDNPITIESLAKERTDWLSVTNKIIAIGLQTGLTQDPHSIPDSESSQFMGEAMIRCAVEESESEEHHWSPALWPNLDSDIFESICETRQVISHPYAFSEVIDGLGVVNWESVKDCTHRNQLFTLDGYCFDYQKSESTRSRPFFMVTSVDIDLDADYVIEFIQELPAIDVLFLCFDIAKLSISLKGEIFIKTSNLISPYLETLNIPSTSAPPYQNSTIDISITEEHFLEEFIENFEQEFSSNFAFRRLKKFSGLNVDNLSSYVQEIKTFIGMDDEIINALRVQLCDLVDDEFSIEDVKEAIHSDFELFRVCESHTRV